jgi:tubulin--tyrosine ligase
LSALKKQDSTVLSNQKNQALIPNLKPFSSGIAPRRDKNAEPEAKEENLTSHNFRTTNHQENNYHLSNKKAIYYNMKVYYDATNQNVFDYLPLTYHIKDGLADREFSKFEDIYNNPDKSDTLVKYPAMGKECWIVKPGENTNRGCGITVCKELS